MDTCIEIPTWVTKKELAAAYCPGLNYDSAKHKLSRWIELTLSF